jgi:hypothetical protein
MTLKLRDRRHIIIRGAFNCAERVVQFRFPSRIPPNRHEHASKQPLSRPLISPSESTSGRSIPVTANATDNADLAHSAFPNRDRLAAREL